MKLTAVRFERSTEPPVRGFLHEAGGADALVLTHGAGSNCDAPLLVAVADALAASGVTVLRIDLPYRQARRGGSPHPSGAARDRAGLERAVEVLRQTARGRVMVGGHSYGGRQASMIAAERKELADGLLLQSYPLHPPGRPEQIRTAHLPSLRAPALFVHGTRDPFGSIDEMRAAVALIPVRTELVVVDRAGHDLSGAKCAARIALAFTLFFSGSASGMS